MDLKKDGGAAFPRATEQTLAGFPGTTEGERGMTLRDFYAASALQGIIARAAFNQEAEDMMKKAGVRPGQVDDFFAMMAFDFADAMIKARNKK